MPPPRPYYDPPTEQERAILDRIAHGDTLPEVGRHVSLTRSGVTWRLGHLRRVWRLRSVRQLLVLAGAAGWATVPDRADKQPIRRSQGIAAIPGRITPGARHPWKGPR